MAATETHPVIVPKLPYGLLWRSLSTDPTMAMCVVTLNGTIQFANGPWYWLVAGREQVPTPEPAHLSQIMEPAWVEERLELLRRCLVTGRTIALRTIWRGRQLLTLIHHVDPREDGESSNGAAGDAEGTDRFLLLSRPAPGDVSSMFAPGSERAADLVKSGVMNLGPLSALSPRELEVLALCGQGMTSKQIAKSLFRSVRTVENHRASIAKKLRVRSATDLTWVARWLGLTTSDVELRRV